MNLSYTSGGIVTLKVQPQRPGSLKEKDDDEPAPL